MSSSSPGCSTAHELAALSSNSCSSSSCLPRNVICRRIRSIALLRPTLTSQARGLEGASSAGQRSSATAKASCNASSARSKSPTRRISVASTRPASSRNTLSISRGVMRSRRSPSVFRAVRSTSPEQRLSVAQLYTQIGRTSIEPNRAPGIRAAIASAASRSLASIR